MEWQEQNQRVWMILGTGPPVPGACVDRWDAVDDPEQAFLSLVAAHRNMGARALHDVAAYGLLRNVEEWDLMMSCARAMVRKGWDPSSLDGQDALTYVARLLQRLSAKVTPSSEGAIRTANAPPPPPRAPGEKRETAGPAEDPIAAPEAAKRRAAKKARKKAARQAKRASLKAQMQTPTQPPDATDVVLHDAATWYNMTEFMSGCTRILGSGEQQQQSTPRLALGLVDRGRGDDIPVSADLSFRGNDAHDTPAIPEPTLPSARKTPTRRSTSHFFAAPAKSGADASVKSPRPPGGTVSALPFPPLTAQQFGLIQEELANDPFRLLIAITFLIKTRGKTAIPVFRALMEKYPTPEALAAADAADITAQIKHLGLSVVRAAQIQKYARTWLETPPTRDRRYGVKNYPRKGDGGGVRGGEPMGPEEEDPRESAWEIGHLTQGPYALDSWRIFCRDALLGRAKDWKGRGRDGQFQPEWMRVLPLDKELRAYLRWMWMQEGWSWDPTTGERDVLSKELQSAVNEGRVAWDNTGALRIAVGPG